MDREPIPRESKPTPEDPEPLADEARELMTDEPTTRTGDELASPAPLGSERAEQAKRAQRRHFKEMFSKLGHSHRRGSGRSRRKK